MNSRDKKTVVSHIKQIRQECTDATSIRLPSCSHNQEPSPPRNKRRTCRTWSLSPISQMAPFFLKWFLVELGHVQKLVELMSSLQKKKLFVAVAFAYTWWRSAVTDGVCKQYTSYVTFSSCCTSNCMAQECVGASHLIYMVIHVVRLSVVRSLTLCSSFPSVSPISSSSSTWTLSWTPSSMWPSSGQYSTSRSTLAVVTPPNSLPNGSPSSPAQARHSDLRNYKSNWKPSKADKPKPLTSPTNHSLQMVPSLPTRDMPTLSPRRPFVFGFFLGPTILSLFSFLQISCFSPPGACSCSGNTWLPTLVLSLSEK